MKYMCTKEAAEKWGLKERTVRELCQKGRVSNVIRSGRNWLIAEDAPRPSTGKDRRKEEASEKLHIYMNPSYCDNHAFSLISTEENVICRATQYFLQGDFDEAENSILEMIEEGTTPNYLALAYLTLLMIYHNSKDNAQIIVEFSSKLDNLLTEHPDFIYTHAFTMLYSSKSLDALTLINLPSELIPLFSFSYIAQKLWDCLSGISQVDQVEIELLCASLSETTNPCILLYFHVALCTYYNLMNKKESYLFHLKKAADIALPRKWYTPFASYSYTCSWIELKAIDADAYNEIARLSNIIIRNYISSGYFKSTLPVKITSPLEIKVAIMSARGMSNPKIAEALDISLYKVKEELKLIYEHLHVKNKEELTEAILFNLKI